MNPKLKFWIKFVQRDKEAALSQLHHFPETHFKASVSYKRSEKCDNNRRVGCWEQQISSLIPEDVCNPGVLTVVCVSVTAGRDSAEIRLTCSQLIKVLAEQTAGWSTSFLCSVSSNFCFAVSSPFSIHSSITSSLLERHSSLPEGLSGQIFSISLLSRQQRGWRLEETKS